MKYIHSLNNATIKQWRKLLTKKERDRTGMFLVEGFHLVEEALKERDRVVELVVSENVQIPRNWNVDKLSMTIVSNEVMKLLVDTKTPQGVVAICQQKNQQIVLERGKTFILIDAVQDPGNVGTIIRTADAAGVDGVIVGEGSADIFQPKVVRSAQGSHFHLPVIKGKIAEWMERLAEQKIPVYGTALENGIPYTNIVKLDSFALIVGNEGSGVSRELLEKTTANLYIPIYGKSESLNVAVATGVLIYHLQSLIRKNK